VEPEDVLEALRDLELVGLVELDERSGVVDARPLLRVLEDSAESFAFYLKSVGELEKAIKGSDEEVLSLYVAAVVATRVSEAKQKTLGKRGGAAQVDWAYAAKLSAVALELVKKSGFERELLEKLRRALEEAAREL